MDTLSRMQASGKWMTGFGLFFSAVALLGAVVEPGPRLPDNAMRMAFGLLLIYLGQTFRSLASVLGELPEDNAVRKGILEAKFQKTRLGLVVIAATSVFVVIWIVKSL